MKRHEVDMLIGQTPCLCGAIDTWHGRCYYGKTKEQVEIEYKKAYRIARRAILRGIEEEQRRILAVARGETTT